MFCSHPVVWHVALLVSRLDLYYVQDSGLVIEPNYVEQFSELNQVLDALRRRDVEPALE